MTITDRHARYQFTPPGSDPRIITGEGTRNMLANAHPGASFLRMDAQDAVGRSFIGGIGVSRPIARPDESKAMDLAYYRTDLHGMHRDVVRDLARGVVPRYSQMPKADLIEALVAIKAVS
jgi:hypothetical protein